VLDIATPPDAQVELMRRAFDAGKHVLSRKPFVEEIVTGETLVEDSERRVLKLAVNQNSRWAPHLADIICARRSLQTHSRRSARRCRPGYSPRKARSGDLRQSAEAS
jgi:predicted dehydrogenase